MVCTNLRRVRNYNIIFSSNVMEFFTFLTGRHFWMYNERFLHSAYAWLESVRSQSMLYASDSLRQTTFTWSESGNSWYHAQPHPIIVSWTVSYLSSISITHRLCYSLAFVIASSRSNCVHVTPIRFRLWMHLAGYKNTTFNALLKGKYQ
jgi:hypothetical protein